MLNITFLLWLLNDSTSFSFQLNLNLHFKCRRSWLTLVPIIYMQIVSLTKTIKLTVKGIKSSIEYPFFIYITLIEYIFSPSFPIICSLYFLSHFLNPISHFNFPSDFLSTLVFSILSLQLLNLILIYNMLKLNQIITKHFFLIMLTSHILLLFLFF